MGIIGRTAAVLALSFVFFATAGMSDPTITISGTVSGPSGVVENAFVDVWNPGGLYVETQTDSAGRYLATLSPGLVHMAVRAPVEERLGWRTFSVGEILEDLDLDVELEAGYLLSGSVLTPGGQPLGGDVSVSLMPLPAGFPGDEWLGTGVEPIDGGLQIVAPADIYWIEVVTRAPWYGAPLAVDLRTADATGVVLTLSQSPVNPHPERPPDATKISFGEIDGLGEASVTGAAGAVPGLSQVLVVNLSSSHQASAVAEEDGSFSTRVFAPPGSAILVKHGPSGGLWLNLEYGVWQEMTPLPGTILHVPFDQSAGPGVGFATAGAVELSTDNTEGQPNWVGAAWSANGAITPGSGPFAPGDSFGVGGTIRVFSHGIDASTNLDEISLQGFGALTLLFDAEGNPVGSSDAFMSTTLTPTLLPIQGEGRANVETGFEPISIEQWQRVGEHAIEGSFDITVGLEPDTPAGTYLPAVFLGFQGVPTTTDWTAGTVYYTPIGPGEMTLPPIVVDDGTLLWEGDQPRRRLMFRLLMEDPTLGTRGTGSFEDAFTFGFASQIATQGAPYIAPPVDLETGLRRSYRLEPYLPMISFTDRRLPGPPLLPFALPGGGLYTIIESPGGGIFEIEPTPFTQSKCRTATTSSGFAINPATTQYNDAYSLTTSQDDYEVLFDRYGPHFVIQQGEVEDVWGNRYTGGGAFELWVAHPLDLDPGVLPGTPFAVGDAFDPAVRITPPVPADVTWTLTLIPDSDPAQAINFTDTGHANAHGSYSSSGFPKILDRPGEYRVTLVAQYVDDDGVMYMGAMTWGGIVMTPPGQADLVAHGRRGVDVLETIPASWFVASQDLDIPDGAIAHAYNPYYGGDILWSRLSDGASGGDALLIVGTVHDTVGEIQDAIEDRLNIDPDNPEMQLRLDAGELPLSIATTTGRAPHAYPEEVEQIAYAYRSSQRPGVRVREVVSQDHVDGGYWRLDTLYDDQFGVGWLGDQPNDFKFQYVGGVYRDLATGHNEYVGQGTGWVFIPEDDPVGTRVMPPFAGPGNGGWTTLGGPILTLGGEEIHIFMVPTGARPGTVLEEGDTLRLAGHIMPTLPSRVSATVTAPSGAVYELDGQANPVGYYYQSDDDLIIDEPGPWSVDLTVWHDGQCSGGFTVPPFPSGGVLGSDEGRFWVYVPSPDAPPIEISSPRPGFLRINDQVRPIPVRGDVPDGLEDVTVHYTIAMPGQILESGQVATSGGRFEVLYDPVALHQDFPNLDLIGRDGPEPGLADTIWIGLLLEGDAGGSREYRATVVTLQGEEVSVGARLTRPPVVPRSTGGRRVP